ncbi:17721_t:CDS:2 [Funneliformis geosporum]|nr:17721_t:CDS:2 [Funneliformis geosporum]
MKEEIVSLVCFLMKEDELNTLIQTPRKRTEPNSNVIRMRDNPNFKNSIHQLYQEYIQDLL